MIQLLFSSILFLVSILAYGQQPVDLGELDSPKDISAELEKRFPVTDWKTIGFCGYKKEPLMTMRVPKFLSWEADCNLYNVKDGIEYCGPDDSSPRLSGTIKIGDREHLLQIGMEAFLSKRPPANPLTHLYFESSTWGISGALIANNAILLGKHEAYLAEIEDTQNKLPKPTKVMTLIKFRHSNIGGMLYFIESEGAKFTPHKDRIFQKIIDEVVKSFQFKVKVGGKKLSHQKNSHLTIYL